MKHSDIKVNGISLPVYNAGIEMAEYCTRIGRGEWAGSIHFEMQETQDERRLIDIMDYIENMLGN